MGVRRIGSKKYCRGTRNRANTIYGTTLKDRDTPSKHFADGLPYQGTFTKKGNKMFCIVNRRFGAHEWWKESVRENQPI